MTSESNCSTPFRANGYINDLKAKSCAIPNNAAVCISSLVCDAVWTYTSTRFLIRSSVGEHEHNLGLGVSDAVMYEKEGFS